MQNSIEMAAEVWRRIDAIKAKTLLRKRVAACMCCLFAIAWYVCLAVQFEGLADIDRAVASVRPSLAFEAIGGYVLIGVMCFASGIAVTLLCLRVRKRNEIRDAQSKKHDTPYQRKENGHYEE